MKRVNSVDFVRGLVMLIMAIDHVRDLMHITGATQDPTDLTTTYPALFFTRWITHLCAPTFVFLAGTSAYLSVKNQENLVESRRFLQKRGLWLIFLECTVITLALWGDFHFRTFLFQVISAIGFGFIILSFLLKFSTRTIGIIGLVIVCGHNLLPLIPFSNDSIVKMVLSPFFTFSFIPITAQTNLVINYPMVPWLGIMLLGFASGQLFELAVAQRKAVLLKMGAGALTLFTLIRLTNFYGDPVHWAQQKDALFTFMSFLNVTKYPPSLLYTLVTLGISCLILSFTEGVNNTFTRVVCIYGKVPLFYYLIHWYIIRILTFLMVFLQGFHWSDLEFGTFKFGLPKTGSGVQLWAIYLIWLGIVLVLYPLCKWFGDYKATHKEKTWLRYL
jgi:uncharacterized membrane protein